MIVLKTILNLGSYCSSPHTYILFVGIVCCRAEQFSRYATQLLPNSWSLNYSVNIDLRHQYPLSICILDSFREKIKITTCWTLCKVVCKSNIITLDIFLPFIYNLGNYMHNRLSIYVQSNITWFT